MKRRIIKNIEWSILICTILLSIIGLVALTSATKNTEYEELKKQIMWLAISIPIMIIIILIDYDIFAKISPVLYGIMIILLIAVLFTEPINGATSWFDIGPFSFQPAEFAKVVCVLFLAWVFTKIQESEKDNINKISRLMLIFIAFAVPVVLIAKQPDYGTALAFVSAIVFMLFSAGIRKRYIITAIILVIILVPLLYFFVLPEHAKTRIDVFLNPELDPLGSGYNAIQSKIAVGSGMLFGTGLLNGAQTQYGYLPIKSTDFIFSVISEEMGFVVSTIIILLYTVLLIRLFIISKNAKDDFSSFMVIGIAGMFFFHFVENIGMTIGLLPITGIPLPFVSYGGSNMLTNCIAIAICLNVSARKSKNMFLD